MPMSHVLANGLCARLDEARRSGELAWAWPGGRVQVTLEYREESDGSVVPARIHSVVVSAQCSSDVKADKVEGDLMEQVVRPTLPEGLCDAKTQYSFPDYARVDAGLSGRRAVADTYGGWGSHGGAGLSGRDASRVSRCGAYAARCCRRPQGQGSSARFPPGP
ncbi:unnamed protein product [Prorocentrum cordatum]|nr:unnamed protein product [Polarella glacialis]